VSVTIDLNNLSQAVSRRPFGYIITVDADGEAHLRAVVPEDRGGSFYVQVGKRSAANVERSHKATFVWPPLGPSEGNPEQQFDDHTVIADCNAESVGRHSADEHAVLFSAYSAVWHRPAR